MNKITSFLLLLAVLLGIDSALAQFTICDVDRDNDVDRADIEQIVAARNTGATGADDPRDATGDGLIDGLDARQCIVRCVFADCTINIPPVADAGPDQPIRLRFDAAGTVVPVTVTLDGSGSSDANSDDLTFQWSLTQVPEGSTAQLSDPGAVMPTFVADVPGTYEAQLIVSDGQIVSTPDSVLISTENIPPVADAGPDQSISLVDAAGNIVSVLVTLDGSGSTDVDGDPLTYEWSLTQVPQGSAAQLSDPSAVMPTFVADRPGTYVAQLIVSDGQLSSALDTVIISTENIPPVANAGLDQSIRLVNEAGAIVPVTVTLNGSGSTDADGDRLTFQWSLTQVPAGSAARLDDPTAVMPTFVADRPGTYQAQLIVSDGQLTSAPDTVLIRTENIPPVADAGDDQLIRLTLDATGRIVPVTVTLDGSGSTDLDGDRLDFRWSLTQVPAGSTARLSDPGAVMPTFVLDVPGRYEAQLIVSDGQLTDLDTVLISTENLPPVANAGPDQSIRLTLDAAGAIVPVTVTLDGSLSFDPEGAKLTYEWSLLSVPLGSTAQLNDRTVPRPTFEADLPGTYMAQLIVSDGQLTDLDTVLISTENLPPVADAGPDQFIQLMRDGEGNVIPVTVTVDFSGSFDPEGDPLNFECTPVGVPPGVPPPVIIQIDPPPVQGCTFVVDQPGTYTVQVRVCDGQLCSMDTVAIVVTIANTPPVADAGDDQTVSPGDTVTLDGSRSFDPDGDPLNFKWSLIEVPPGSGAKLDDPTAVRPTFMADLPGRYVAQLIVNDGRLSSAPDTVSITAFDANRRPVADAGPDQSRVLMRDDEGGIIPDPVTLDGSGSSDPEGHGLNFDWELIQVPPDSNAKLDNPKAVMPTFVPDVGGVDAIYKAQLIVNDGQLSSDPDTVVIIANTPPIANAGVDRQVVGVIRQPPPVVTLDGSGSSDPDGDPLVDFEWLLIQVPPGSGAKLDDPTVVSPTFVADRPGEYKAQLIVNDGQLGSDPDTVVITVIFRDIIIE